MDCSVRRSRPLVGSRKFGSFSRTRSAITQYLTNARDFLLIALLDVEERFTDNSHELRALAAADGVHTEITQPWNYLKVQVASDNPGAAAKVDAYVSQRR